MRERPILFNHAMVRAILSGAKTQTRRPVKFPPRTPDAWEPTTIGGAGCTDAAGHAFPEQGAFWNAKTTECLASPFGFVGDLLWVRECWQIVTGREAGDMAAVIRFRADNEMHGVTMPWDKAMPLGLTWDRWRPSIHLPRWASRLTLRVTDVRVERVQDITPEDAIAEGVFGEGRYAKEAGTPYPVATFAQLWRDTYGPESWDANPWVWCVSFERAEVPR